MLKLSCVLVWVCVLCIKPKHIVCESKTPQHCCWPTATSFTQWMNDAETWVDVTWRILLHTVCLFLSTPGLRAWAPRQDKRNEKTQRSAEEKLLSARKCQRQSSYMDYSSHNPSLSLESTYNPQGLHIPGFLSGPESIYQSSFSIFKDPYPKKSNFVQTTYIDHTINPRVQSSSGTQSKNNLSSRSGQPDVPALNLSVGLTGPIHHYTVWCSITAICVKPQLAKLFHIAYFILSLF